MSLQDVRIRAGHILPLHEHLAGAIKDGLGVFFFLPTFVKIIDTLENYGDPGVISTE